MLLFRAGLSCCLLLSSTSAATADDKWTYSQQSVSDLKEQIAEGPFNPQSLALGHESVRLGVQYTGDDRSWPVWSMAIVSGCPGTAEQCERHVLKARVISAAGLKSDKRRRNAGHRMVHETARNMYDGDNFEAAFAKTLPDWEYAEIQSCKGAQAHLEKGPEQNWLPAGFPRAKIKPSMHADKIEITLSNFQTTLTHKGVPYADTPQKWAQDLYKIIMPCLSKSYMTPPWAR